ncbi:MAG: hypothetical protein IKT10_00560 [Clostridiales bacterium]|nr:hypothetical protein [Clostridiales bacterium]
MENRAIRSGTVEMNVICSDLSLLENINTLLREKGVISVEDESGVLHYIVDGRYNRKEAAGRVTSLRPRTQTDLDPAESYLELCVKSVLREYGFDMSHIGTILIHKSLFDSFSNHLPLPTTMKSLYCETGKVFGLTLEQSERDVRYAITKSCLKNMRSRAALRCIQSRIERRLGYLDPLD